MKLVDITGTPLMNRSALADLLDPIADAEGKPGTPPKDHEPKWFKGRVDEANKAFADILQRWENTMNEPMLPGVIRDEEAIKRFHGHQWAEYASDVMTSKTPIALNKKAMYEKIAQIMAAHKVETERKLPLSEVKDLEPHGFKLVGQCTHGTVWISSAIVLCVNEGGMVLLSMRNQCLPLGPWYRTKWLRDDTWEDANQFDGYRLEELHMLLAGLRVPGMSHPNESELAMARGEKTVAAE